MGKAARRKRERSAADRETLLQTVIANGPPEATPMEQAFTEMISPTFEALYNFSKNAPLWLTTGALKNLSRIAREQGMSRPLNEAVEADLDPGAHHVVLWAARHWTPDFKYDNVRAMLALGTNDWRRQGANADPVKQIVDLPTRQFALMCVMGTNQFSAQPVQSRLAEDLGLDLDAELGVREWTGTRSMNRVANNLTAFWHLLAACEVYGTDHGMAERFSELGWPLDEIEQAVASAQGPRIVQAPPLLRKLRAAHPIVCEPEWTQAMDDFDDWDEAFTFAKQINLPFDVVYLDLMGNGYCPLIPITDPNGNAPKGMTTLANQARAVRISGALVFRDEDTQQLIVAPLGCPGMVPEGSSGFTGLDPLGFGVYDILGIVSFDQVPATPWEEFEIGYPDSEVRRKALVCAPVGEGPRGVSPVRIPARIQLPFGVGQLKDPDNLGEDLAYLWASLTWAAARRVLRTLSMLQAGNVELVEAQVSRQERRAGQRAGQPVAKQVVVRLNRKQYTRPPGMESGTVDWSHAWWVSGHPRYYPLGTQKADAQPPEKLLNHPTKGVCFMEWVPPYIKGNRERGVVEKTRVVRERGER